jgi:hypothetical protein
MLNIEQTSKEERPILLSSPPSHRVAMFANEDKPWFEFYKAAMHSRAQTGVNDSPR